MSYRFCALTLILFSALGLCHIYGEEIRPEIVFRAQTKEEEFARIKYTISKLPWYKKNGYPITLPQHKNFEELYLEAEKPASSTSDSPYFPENPHLPNEDYYQEIFFNEIYDSNSYAKGLSVLSAGKEDVEKALIKLAALHKNWGFKLMPKYLVLLTLYGVGGSYHFGEGLVFVKGKPEGIFSYHSPSGTTIHEIVHIGIEENIVRKFKLSHWEKEYLVDSICSIYLKDILPKYKFQKDLGKKLHPDRKDSGMTAPDIAGFVTEEAIVLDLPLAISNFVREYPR